MRTISDKAGALTKHVGTAMADSKFNSAVKKTSKGNNVESVGKHSEQPHNENKTINRHYFVPLFYSSQFLQVKTRIPSVNESVSTIVVVVLTVYSRANYNLHKMNGFFYF